MVQSILHALRHPIYSGPWWIFSNFILIVVYLLIKQIEVFKQTERTEQSTLVFLDNNKNIEVKLWSALISRQISHTKYDADRDGTGFNLKHVDIKYNEYKFKDAFLR